LLQGHLGYAGDYESRPEQEFEIPIRTRKYIGLP
jgi:hypothetical protein